MNALYVAANNGASTGSALLVPHVSHGTSDIVPTWRTVIAGSTARRHPRCPPCRKTGESFACRGASSVRWLYLVDANAADTCTATSVQHMYDASHTQGITRYVIIRAYSTWQVA